MRYTCVNILVDWVKSPGKFTRGAPRKQATIWRNFRVFVAAKFKSEEVNHGRLQNKLETKIGLKKTIEILIYKFCFFTVMFLFFHFCVRSVSDCYGQTAWTVRRSCSANASMRPRASSTEICRTSSFQSDDVPTCWYMLHIWIEIGWGTWYFSMYLNYRSLWQFWLSWWCSSFPSLGKRKSEIRQLSVQRCNFDFPDPSLARRFLSGRSVGMVGFDVSISRIQKVILVNYVSYHVQKLTVSIPFPFFVGHLNLTKVRLQGVGMRHCGWSWGVADLNWVRDPFIFVVPIRLVSVVCYTPG